MFNLLNSGNNLGIKDETLGAIIMSNETDKTLQLIKQVGGAIKNIPHALKGQSRKVRTVAYVVVVLWIAVLSQLFVNHYFTDDSMLVDAFTKTNSSVLNSNLYMVADMGDDYMSEEDEKNLLQYMSSKIGLTEDCEISQSDDGKMISTKRESDQATTIIKLVRNKEKTKKDTYIVRRYLILDLTIKNDVHSILSYKKKAENIADKLNAKTYESQVTFTGTYDGELNLEEKNTIADQFLKDLQASTVVEQRGNDLYTVYGYTGLISDYVKSEGNRINVNVVFTYNEKKNKTNLYVATPILNQDY